MDMQDLVDLLDPLKSHLLDNNYIYTHIRICINNQIYTLGTSVILRPEQVGAQAWCLRVPLYFLCFCFCFFFAVLRFELRASPLQDRYSTI
jgi:hypothetical protein